ncbi:MAG: tRNA (guanosine(46)-N7)-methyltransferase TrmB [Acholeplasmataceae bacterium]|nr:tRNA (guanosine(46)-N7)-methyltransferase TrmB [Acholeplasmataceae bacterium]
MRTKKIKQASSGVNNSSFVTKENNIIKSDKPVHLEIGSGKGQFIYGLATLHQEHVYVALEKDINVAYRIVQKQEEQPLNNLSIINDDALHLEKYFEFHSISTLYLNFSDPWPKTRHHKRRLTFPTFLKLYKQYLTKDGIIELRTDHLELFNDSIDYFESEGFIITELSYDSPVGESISEYETKKRLLGPIYSLKAKLEA